MRLILLSLPVLAFALNPPHEHKVCEALGKCWRNGDCVLQPCTHEDIPTVEIGPDEICRGNICLRCDKERENCELVYRPLEVEDPPSTPAPIPEIICSDNGINCVICDENGCRPIYLPLTHPPTTTEEPTTTEGPVPSTGSTPLPLPFMRCKDGVCYICIPNGPCIPLLTPPPALTTTPTTTESTTESTTSPTTTSPSLSPSPFYVVCHEGVCFNCTRNGCEIISNSTPSSTPEVTSRPTTTQEPTTRPTRATTKRTTPPAPIPDPIPTDPESTCEEECEDEGVFYPVCWLACMLEYPL